MKSKKMNNNNNADEKKNSFESEDETANWDMLWLFKDSFRSCLFNKLISFIFFLCLMNDT